MSIQSDRRKVLATDAMLVAMALIWAVNYSVLKFGTRLVPPLAYNGVRIPAAALLQFGIARAMRLGPIARKDAIQLVVLGMLGNGIYQVFFILGQARSRVATTVLMLASGPALAAVLGRLRGSEFLTRRSWIGIVLQLLGVSCVVLGTAGGTGGRDSLLGSALVFASAISWALFSVMVQPLTTRVPGLQVGAYTMLGGGIVSFIVGMPAIETVQWGSVSTAVWGAMAYSTIGAMVIAYRSRCSVARSTFNWNRSSRTARSAWLTAGGGGTGSVRLGLLPSTGPVISSEAFASIVNRSDVTHDGPPLT